MNGPTPGSFPLVDVFICDPMGIDPAGLGGNPFRVFPSALRESAVPGQPQRRPFTWLQFGDGRGAASVVGGIEEEVGDLLTGIFSPDVMFELSVREQIRQYLNRHFEQQGFPKILRIAAMHVFAAADENLRKPSCPGARLIDDPYLAFGSPVLLSENLIRGGLAYGILEDEGVVSAAWARAEIYERFGIGDINVETCPECEGKGYEAACAYALAKSIIGKGGEVVLTCFPDFPDYTASAAFAESLGFVSHVKCIFGMPSFPESDLQGPDGAGAAQAIP